MSEDTRQNQEVILGKKFPGEKFATIKSAEDVAEVQKLNEEHAHENAVPLSAYCSKRGHHDSVLQRMLETSTQVRTATVEAFDKIFASFFGISEKAEPSDPKKEV